MCIIVACPPQQYPDKDDLWDATWENDDGHGWAIRTPHGLEVFTSMNSCDAIDTFLDMRNLYPESWAIWHSRFATHGETDITNAQPFRVPGRDWVMAHNGMLPLSDGPFDQGRSDSRILAEDHLSRTTWKQMYGKFATIDEWIRPSKVVILSANKEKGGPIFFFGQNRGTWEADRCWWSARPYRSRWNSYTTTSGYKYVSNGDGKLIRVEDEPEVDEETEWYGNRVVTPEDDRDLYIATLKALEEREKQDV